MVERIFQVLDVTYDIEAREPVILLWVRMEDNTRALLRLKGFYPYFYALLDKQADPNAVAGKVQRLQRPESPIRSINLVEKKFIGRPARALRIETRIPKYVALYRDSVAKIDGVKDVLEADIRFSMRFLLDNNIYPMRWYRADLVELRKPTSLRVDNYYEVNSKLVEAEGFEKVDPLKDLRILAFDIEVYNPMRSPDPKRDKIIIIGYIKKEDREPVLLTAENRSDAAIIKEFVEAVIDYDPDIIVGYNQNRFDWPYMVERSRYLGIRLDVGRRVGAIPQPSVYGHYSVPGRLNVDLYDFAEELYEVKVKSLEEVADYLGVMRKDERPIVEGWKIGEYWDDPEKRKILLEYAKADVVATMGLAEKFLPFGAQLSTISGLPMDQVMAASVGYRLEWRLMREAYKLNELVPNRVERKEERYTGAIVLKPQPGVHENIAVLDFASMYPNIMVKYNVGPDTLIRPGEQYDPNNVNIAPEVGHKFRKHPPGFFKIVVQKFLDIRRKLKHEMKKYKPGTPYYKLLDERQRAVKLLANASYGYLGWSHARWYCRPCAESITAWGRNLIKQAIRMARSLGLSVIYGDTDSLFVTYDKKKVEEFIRRVEEELGFEVKIDKIYKRVFFTEAKKRYVGLTIDGHIDVVGFEAVRGDWSELAKETQMKVAEIVLATGDVDKAIQYVQRVIRDLREGKIDLSKLIIWKTLTKRPEEYHAEQPHVTAAKIMRKLGYRVGPGAKIGFIIVKGKGPISKRAKPYFIVNKEEVDVEYYVDKQVIPAALRILSYFGVTEKKLKGVAGRKTLLDFFS